MVFRFRVLVGNTDRYNTSRHSYNPHADPSVIGDSIPRFIQHLSPRYTARFRAGSELVKFMTYESATSLSIHVTNVNTRLSVLGPSPDKTQKAKALQELMTAVKNGLEIGPNDVLVCLTSGSRDGERSTSLLSTGEIKQDEPKPISLEGDVFEVPTTPLDLSMWKLGGAAVALGLLQYANVS